MFTDLQGSTVAWERHPELMGAVVAQHDGLLRDVVTAHDGRIVKGLGDGVMAQFGDPASAVAAAVEAQRAVRRASWPEELGAVAIRVGIHTGLVDPRDDDVFGPAVNCAARIEQSCHGGQALVSAATKELVGDRVPDVTFVDLGEHQLRGLDRGVRLFQVCAADLESNFPPLRTDSAPTNVPAATVTMIGRESELTEVEREFDAGTRLITLTGVGGVGKTTLALEVARRAVERFPAGVWLVGLAGLNDGSRIATECLGAIRSPAAGDRDHVGLLVEALAGQRSLLVLDNCEHLRLDVTRVVAEIMSHAREVVVLATSREPLAVHGERVWQVPVLTLPGSGSVADVMASDAGRLFVAKATEAAPTFELTDQNSAVVAELCEQLDGLPLAIELACARLRSMGLDDLASRLVDRFRVLKSPTTASNSHHQTLRGTVAWSYDLLSGQEQTLLRWLSVFVGFDLGAAEAIGVPLDDDVIDVLDHLVAHSLVQHNNGRYRMLNTIRQFGYEQLEDEREEIAARSAHLRWMRDLAATGGRQLEGRDQYVWLARFQEEIDNIRAAFEFAIAHDPAPGAEIARQLTRFFWLNAMEASTKDLTESRSYLAEGYDWSTRLLDAAGSDLDDHSKARLLTGIGGMLCIRAGKYEEAVRRLEEAQTLCEAAEDRPGVGWAKFYSGMAGWDLRPLEDTIECFARADSIFAETGSRHGELLAVLLGAYAHGHAGRVREGRELVTRYVEDAQRLGAPFLVAHAFDLGAIYDAWEDRVSAVTFENLCRAVDGFRSTHNHACLSHTLGAGAMAFARLEDMKAAARMLGLSQSLRDSLNMVIAPYEDRADQVLALIDAAGHDLTDPATRDAWHRELDYGRTMNPHEGLDWAIHRLEDSAP